MEYKFNAFERVVARDELGTWVADIYSHYDAKDEYGAGKHVCIGANYDVCLPYESNKYLLGTKDAPKHEYKWGDKVEFLNDHNTWQQALFIEEMVDGSYLIVMKRRTENVFYGVESSKIRPLKEVE